MNFKVESINANEIIRGGSDMFVGTRKYIELIGDDLINVSEDILYPTHDEERTGTRDEYVESDWNGVSVDNLKSYSLGVPLVSVNSTNLTLDTTYNFSTVQGISWDVQGHTKTITSAYGAPFDIMFRCDDISGSGNVSIWNTNSYNNANTQMTYVTFGSIYRYVATVSGSNITYKLYKDGVLLTTLGPTTHRRGLYLSGANKNFTYNYGNTITSRIFSTNITSIPDTRSVNMSGDFESCNLKTYIDGTIDDTYTDYNGTTRNQNGAMHEVEYTYTVTVEDNPTDYASSVFNQDAGQPNWKLIQPDMRLNEDNALTVIGDGLFNSFNSFTTSENINVGDYICTDRLDISPVIDVTGNMITLQDNIVVTDDIVDFNPVRDGIWQDTDFGLREALQELNNATVYSGPTTPIVLDAGEGNILYVGDMYTLGDDLDPMLFTARFTVETSDDGTEWTMLYDSMSTGNNTRTHIMSAETRFIRLSVLEEYDGWGRIRFNSVNGNWDLQIKKVPSTMYKFNSTLKINTIEQTPTIIKIIDNKEWVEYVQMSVDFNTINFETYLGKEINCNCWYEEEGYR